MPHVVERGGHVDDRRRPEQVLEVEWREHAALDLDVPLVQIAVHDDGLSRGASAAMRSLVTSSASPSTPIEAVQLRPAGLEDDERLTVGNDRVEDRSAELVRWCPLVREAVHLAHQFAQ